MLVKETPSMMFGTLVHRWSVPDGDDYHGRTDVTVEVRRLWDGDVRAWWWTVSIDGREIANRAREEHDAITYAFRALWQAIHGERSAEDLLAEVRATRARP